MWEILSVLLLLAILAGFLAPRMFRRGPGAAPLSGGTPVAHFTINVALVLYRSNDPTALLSEDWGSRQRDLAALNASGTLWSTYGANTHNYNQAVADLGSLPVQVKTVDQVSPVNGYVSSAESRTI